MLTPAQSAIRAKGIGASEVAAILGVDPYRTPYDLWANKTGRGAPDETSIHARIGNALEPAILSLASEHLSRPVATPNAEADPETWAAGHFKLEGTPLFCHVDGMVGDRLWAGHPIVEAKSTRISEGWGEPGTDMVPDRVLLQVTAQMLCAGSEVAYIPRLLLDRYGEPFAMYEVGLNGDLAHVVMDAVGEFWAKHVQADTPPAITDRAPDRRIFDRIERQAGRVAVIPVEVAERFLTARDSAKAAETELEAAKAALVAAFGDAEVGQAGEMRFSYTFVSQRRFDAGAFNLAHPELHEEFTTTAGYRRLNAPRAKKGEQ